MKRLFLFAVLFVLSACMVQAEVLTLTIDKGQFVTGETATVSGFTLDDNLGATNSTNVSLYLDGSYVSSLLSGSDGSYYFLLANLSEGNRTVNVTTPSSNKVLAFSVLSQIPVYTISSSSLAVPYATHSLDLTVTKTLDDEEASGTYEYVVYSSNGTLVGNGTGNLSAAATIALPQRVDLYTVVVDDVRSFTVSVVKFSLKFKIIDAAGAYKDVFKPGGVAFFEVEGFSGGQRLEDATVTARVTDPQGAVKTVVFSETSGVYNGSTNYTRSTPVQLRSGDYEVEFKMQDASGNEQKVKGYFKVLGLSVTVDLAEKRPYAAGETVQFDVTVKNLENGNVLEHNATSYTYSLKHDGKSYDTSSVVAAEHADGTKTSLVSYTVPVDISDGDFFLSVKATADGKVGKGTEFFEVMNNEVFIELTDNYDDPRHQFKPGELAKLSVESDEQVSLVRITVKDKNGNVRVSTNGTINGTNGDLTFNVPSTQEEFFLEASITTPNGVVKRSRWFQVQNYFSFLDTLDGDGLFALTFASDEGFLAEINAFDIASGDALDLSGFKVKFESIVNEETGSEYANLVATLDAARSDAETGRLVYSIDPPALPNGFYSIAYTLVDDGGKSVSGDGFFAISAFGVTVQTFDDSGAQESFFVSGATVNVTINTTELVNGTATLHREFFDPISFSVEDGFGWVSLTALDNRLPSESGFYGFGVEVVTDDGEQAFGDGFFEIRNLDFRSITVRNNGKFNPGDDVIADVVVERSGELLNASNVSLLRLVRTTDWKEFPASGSASLTSSLGRTTLTVTPGERLPEGDYFVDIRASKDGSAVYGGFGFRVVGDKVEISLTDADQSFSSTDTIEINVLVTSQNDTPRNNVTVTLAGLLNLNTWAPLSANRQATTASNGVATITLSAANYNIGRYAPIINVSNMTVVGFGDSEFEIVPFSTVIAFSDDESFSRNESLIVDVNVTGTVTVTAEVTDHDGNAYPVDYYYADGVLTVQNNLVPGEYFLDVTVTQSGQAKTVTLWFEVLAPWMHVDSLEPSTVADNETLNISYVVFTSGAQGWVEANGTVNVSVIENLWTGDETVVGDAIAAFGAGYYLLDLDSYDLPQGDYVLRFSLAENDEFEHELYFRVFKDILIDVFVSVNESNATFTVSTAGLSSPTYRLVDYQNFDSFEYTLVDTAVTSPFSLTGLDNGFYTAKIEITSGSEVFYQDVFFDVRVYDVTIDAPQSAFVGDAVSFNISAPSDTYFWIIDPFTQSEKLKVAVSAGDSLETYTFSSPGNYIYGAGATKADVFVQPYNLFVEQQGFSVQWQRNNRFIVGGDMNFSFNVTAQANNTNLTLTAFNHFSGEETSFPLGGATGSLQQFTIDLSSLEQGPHDIAVVMETGVAEPPTERYFVDIFSDQYDIWTWMNQQEYKVGDTVTINFDARDILSDWAEVDPDSITLELLENPFGDSQSAVFDWTSPNRFATIQTDDSWITGNYHAELQFTIGSTQRTFPVDFFVRGNDDLNVYSFQDRWDYAPTETFSLRLEARDGDQPAAGVPVTLTAFEFMPDDQELPPVDALANLSGAVSFSNASNVTYDNGTIRLAIDLSVSDLNTGQYSGRVNVGGRVVWFDFNVRTYQVDTYTTQWEYGINEVIELNVRTRDFVTWDPLVEDGMGTVKKIRKHLPNDWQSEEVPLSSFGILNPVFTITDGEALIEMQANQSALNLTSPFEFEVELETTLSSSGSSQGWAWFRLSDSERASASVVDQTGSVPDAYFSGQSYTLQVSGADSATLRNLWGPRSQYYGTPLSGNGTLTVNFTTPDAPGWYTLEVEILRGDGGPEYLYVDFQIGGSTDMKAFLEGNVVPEVPFAAYVKVFGEGTDPWCEADPFCTPMDSWFGPLGNKTVNLTGIQDLETFVTTPVSAVSSVTNDFPWYLLPFDESACDVSTENACSAIEQCAWTNGDKCEVDQPEDEMMGPASEPGVATFLVDPADYGLIAGKKYNLIFSYVDNEGVVTTANAFAQVEEFHVAISKREEDLAANALQYVWIATTDLYGDPLSCNTSFDGIYDEKNFQLVKDLSVLAIAGDDGEAIFNYTTPSLPGEYLVEGTAWCDTASGAKSQDIGFFIQVGAKSLEVDMDTKFAEEETIKLSLNTKDRLGNPTSQRFEVMLFHDLDDFNQTVFSDGGADCTVLDAGRPGFFDGMGDMSNRIELETDASGSYELELCPLPSGNYFLEVFPLFDFDQGGSDDNKEGDAGFHTDFIVSTGDIEMTTAELVYSVGDRVDVSMTVLDDDDDAVDGEIVSFEVFGEDFEGGKFILYELEDSVNVTNGTASLNFTVPVVAEDKETGDNVSLNWAPVSVYMVVQSGDKYFIYNQLQFVVSAFEQSSVVAPASVKTNRLIDVNVTTSDDSRYKVQFGSFFLQDNMEKMKDWMIENGMFLRNMSGNESGAHFMVLSPKEPGSYFLAMPVYLLNTSPSSMSSASELLLTRIDISLDVVNVTGSVVLDGSPLVDALVRIGKVETTTDAQGKFSAEVPKGKKSVEVERKLSDHTEYVKTGSLDFNVSREINVTFYSLALGGELQQTLFNISSPSTDLSTMKLRINATVNNSGADSFTNLTLKAVARSGESIRFLDVSMSSIGSVLFKNLQPGYESGDYKLVIKLKSEEMPGYVLLDGSAINATVGGFMKRDYEVLTYAAPGDGLDNDGDCDGFSPFYCADSDNYVDACIDEEKDNNKDDDCDGRIDEDIEGVDFDPENGWCGDGFCSDADFQNSCFSDCGLSTGYCGDGACDVGEELSCADDCNVTVCSSTNTCADDGSAFFCNMWGVFEPADWCASVCDADNCWACSVDGSPGSTQCEAVGCSLGKDSMGSWCYRDESCGDDACNACGSEGECTGTSLCEWENDSFAPAGGWCDRPWNCDSECGACEDEGACLGSSAEMDNASCRWKNDSFNPDGGWCEWDLDYIPPGQGGEGIVHNVWLSLDNETPDYQSVVDMNCYSGNCAEEIDAGSYYLMVHMGDTMVNVSVNGTVIDTIDNSGGYFDDFAVSVPFSFANGTWQVEVVDLIGPDYVSWFVDIGANVGSGSGDGPLGYNVSVLIQSPVDDELISKGLLNVTYNISGNLTGYVDTEVYFDGFSAFQTDGLGQNVYFNDSAAFGYGPLNITVKLRNGSGDPMAWDWVVVNVTDNGSGEGGLYGNVSGSPAYENVLIEVFDGESLVASNRTDGDGLFNFSLPSGMYDVLFVLDDQCVSGGMPCPEMGVSIEVENVSVASWQDLNIQVPHMGYELLVNETPVNLLGLTPLWQNGSYEFILNVSNMDNFTIPSVVLEFNASDGGGDWGLQSVFTDSASSIAPASGAMLVVPFGAWSVPMVRSADVVVDLQVLVEEVVWGEVDPGPVTLVIERQLGFNVTEVLP